MTFKEERELKANIIGKMIDLFNQRFMKENISTPRDLVVKETVEEVFSQLRVKDLLK